MRLKFLPLLLIASYFLFLSLIIPDHKQVLGELKEDARVLSQATLVQIQKIPERTRWLYSRVLILDSP